MLAGSVVVDEIGRNTHDNYGAGPLHDPGAEEGRTAGEHSGERHCFFILSKSCEKCSTSDGILVLGGCRYENLLLASRCFVNA